MSTNSPQTARAGVTVLAFALIAPVTLTDAHADEIDGKSLVVEKRCVACHDMTRTLIGPSYVAVAARHSAQGTIMIEVLARKIIAGGAGNWGVVPIVPNEHVTLAEARAMSRWILGLDQPTE